MSKKKARLIHCNNFTITQFYNLYLNNKPIVNSKFKIKLENHYYSKNYDSLNYNSLKYTILQSNFSNLNSSIKNFTIYNSQSMYFKKYFNNLINNHINFRINFMVINILFAKNIIYKNIIFKKQINIIRWFYKRQSKRFIRKYKIYYDEKQNENKLIMRKLNIYKNYEI